MNLCVSPKVCAGCAPFTVASDMVRPGSRLLSVCLSTGVVSRLTVVDGPREYPPLNGRRIVCEELLGPQLLGAVGILPTSERQCANVGRVAIVDVQPYRDELVAWLKMRKDVTSLAAAWSVLRYRPEELIDHLRTR